MKIRIKKRIAETGRWTEIDIYDLFGQSIIEFMRNTKERVIAAVYDDEHDEPVMYIANNETDVDKYKKKGWTFSVQEIDRLFQTENVPKVVIEQFPDGKFIDARSK